jgi:hypothetical protein
MKIYLEKKKPKIVNGIDNSKEKTDIEKAVLFACEYCFAPMYREITTEVPTEKVAIIAYKSPKNCIDMPADAMAEGETLPSMIISTST